MRTMAGRWPDSADLLSRRLAELQLDERAIASSEPAVLRDLQRVCGQCPEDRLCARDLKRDQEAGQRRELSPNVATLDALRTEDRDRRWIRRRKWPEPNSRCHPVADHRGFARERPAPKRRRPPRSAAESSCASTARSVTPSTSSAQARCGSATIPGRCTSSIRSTIFRRPLPRGS